MKTRYLLIAVFAFLLQDTASEGKRWWSHVEFLADDGLEGRNVGTPGYEKAAAYVEAQFKDIGLTPGGSETFLKEGGQIELTQSALVLENLINKLFASIASKGPDQQQNGQAPAPSPAAPGKEETGKEKK